MRIDDYINSIDSEGSLADHMRRALDDYHAHEDFIPVNTWDAVAEYESTSKGMDFSDDKYNTEQILSNGFVQRFLKDHNINVYSCKETVTSIVYYVDCINSPAHTTSNKAHTDTFISVCQSGIINYHCNHAHCDGIHWKDFKEYYKNRNEKQKDPRNVTTTKEFDIKLVQGRALQKKELPPIVYPVENMIPQGYTVASAPFKYGKSWFALEMCLAIAEGVPFLGHNTTKGAAIYMALEDCENFAQERLNMVLDGKEAPEDFYYIYNVPTLDDGLLDYLNQLFNMFDNLRIVVIDVLALINYQEKRGESAYKCDYRTGSALKTWADEHNTSILAITHTTKMIHPNDVFMNTIGTNGVTGAADGLLTIAKENRTDKEAILAITGRRIREKYYQVHLRDGYIWENNGEIDPQTMEQNAHVHEQEERLNEYKTSDIRTAICKILTSGNDKELSSRDIVEEARAQGIYLKNTPKEIGGFICKYQNYFYTEDSIKVFIRKRGTGSNLYTFKAREDATTDANDLPPQSDS